MICLLSIALSILVVIMVVLAHVLYTERVAKEIFRILKIGSWLYSALPFMQQVHEDAYDFMCYTLSGYRLLFNGFAGIDRGIMAGPSTALVWAVENFVLDFVSWSALRTAAKDIVRLLIVWIKYFDRILWNFPAAMDGFSCTYLLGCKHGKLAADAKIITRYVGKKN